MNFETARPWIVSGVLVASFAALITVIVLARRRRILPLKGFGWMVTDAHPGGVGHPSMVVIDCHLCGGPAPGGADVFISFTVQAKAGAAPAATIVRTPRWDELRARTAAREPVIVGAATGVWRIDAPLVSGSTLRIRLFDVDVASPPMLSTSSPDVDVKALDRRALSNSSVKTLSEAFALPTMILGGGGSLMSLSASSRPWTANEAMMFVFCWAIMIPFSMLVSYKSARFGGLMLMHLAATGFAYSAAYEEDSARCD